MPTEIIVALITGGFGLVGILIERARRQNNRDHASNSDKLDQVIEKIDKVDSRVSGHIEWHLDGSSR
jgi:hypothetical protein